MNGTMLDESSTAEEMVAEEREQEAAVMNG